MPFRRDNPLRHQRWFANLGLAVLSAVFLRLALPFLAVAAALWAKWQGVGLLNWFGLASVSPFLAGTLAFVLLDLAIWFQHWASHKVPVLWRLHKVHHTDTHVDVSTALRFHPIEITASMLWKIAVVVVVGAPPLAVLIFEILLNAAAIFNHANISLPTWAERPLRWLIVTPDMHRIHHSVRPAETDSNYGFNLSIWDRMFGSYTAAAKDPQESMQLGLGQVEPLHSRSLLRLIALPFSRSTPPKSKPSPDP
nr:sterol desaturase family protein [Pseudovibrio hongkongensis]